MHAAWFRDSPCIQLHDEFFNGLADVIEAAGSMTHDLILALRDHVTMPVTFF